MRGLHRKHRIATQESGLGLKKKHVFMLRKKNIFFFVVVEEKKQIIQKKHVFFPILTGIASVPAIFRVPRIAGVPGRREKERCSCGAAKQAPRPVCRIRYATSQNSEISM